MIDGVFQLSKGSTGVVLPIGTVSKHGRWHRIAYAVASGETKWTTTTALSAVEQALQNLFPDELKKSRYFITDLGSVYDGVQEHIERASEADDQIELEHGACSVHLLKNNLPNLLQKHVVNWENSGLLYRDVKRLRLFPRATFARAVEAVLSHWRSIGEIKSNFRNYILKQAMDGTMEILASDFQIVQMGWSQIIGMDYGRK
jgi:hypothetical protein